MYFNTKSKCSKYLVFWLTYVLLQINCFATNPDIIRQVTESGTFLRVATTVKQQFYTKASGMVIPSGGGTPAAASLDGHWETTQDAMNSFKNYISGQGTLSGAISLTLGAAEVISGPNTVDQKSSTDTTAPVKSVEATNTKIAASQADGWTFKEWLSKPPPECEIPGNVNNPPGVPDTSNPLKITYKKITNYSWTARWKESKPVTPP